MTKIRTAGVLLAAVLLAGCGTTAPQPTAPASAASADPDGEIVDGLPFPKIGKPQAIEGGTVNLLSVRWEQQAERDSAGRPKAGWWLVCDIEVKAITAPVYMSTWDWVNLSAYSGEGVGPKLWGDAYDADVHIPVGVSLSGERMAFDPDPGQASIVEWASDNAAGHVAAWYIPPKDGK